MYLYACCLFYYIVKRFELCEWEVLYKSGYYYYKHFPKMLCCNPYCDKLNKTMFFGNGLS